MKLKDINKKEFEDFCKTQEHDNFFQSKYYAEIKRLDGYHTYFVGLEESGKILAATLLLSKNVALFNFREFYAPRGFILDYKNTELVKTFTEKIVEYVKNKKGVLIKINPLVIVHDRDSVGNIIEGGLNNTKLVETLKELGWYQGPNELKYPIEEQIAYKINLNNKNNDELFSKFSDSLRDKISENELIGITTKKIDKSNIQKLIDLLEGSSLVSDHLRINHGNYHEIANILDTHNMLDLTAAELNIDKYLEYLSRKKETSESEDVLKELELAKQLQYEYGHTVLIGLTLGVIYNNNYYVLTHINNKYLTGFNPLLTIYWETIKEANSKGCESYNLYEIGNSIEDNPMLEEIMGLGGKVVELIGEFNYIINDRYYKKCMKIQKKALY